MVSVVIVNYLVKKELWDCIKSINSSKSKNAYEIIVVDNDEEKSIEKDLKKKFPAVIYVPNENKGFGHGNNTGIKRAKGNYIFFLNPDTKIYPGCIDFLVGYLKQHRSAAISAPLVLEKDQKPYPLQGAQELTLLRGIFAFSFINKLFPWSKNFQEYWMSDWDKKSIRKVASVPGTSFMIRKNVYKKVGGFDENFFLFFEEIDLCKRVRESGWKIVMCPSAKVYHAWGSSTKKSKRNITKIFEESRFYYFRKHFGIGKALLLEFFLRINKNSLLLFLILLLGFFLRVTNLENNMSFIGDQGWFYLSARDMILTGKIPLVGITSSHVWLHQGPYWTYILAVIFKIFNFNPVAPAYFTVLIGTVTAFLIYKIFKEMFSRRMALISALFYSISPLIVQNDRFPYHTTLIPFFTLLLTYALYKWVYGNRKYFVFSIILVGVLYNFELATFSLGGVLVLFFLYGFFKKDLWFVKTVSLKSLYQTLFGIGLVMLPVFIYDIVNGLKQSLGFGAWIIYKLFLFLPNVISNKIGESKISLVTYLYNKYQLLTFSQNGIISLVILIASIFYILFLLLTLRSEKRKFLLILAMFLVPLLGFLTAGVKSDAYIPIFFTTLIAMNSLMFDLLIGKVRFIGVALILIVVFSNIYSLSIYNITASKGITFLKREEAVDQILKLTQGKEYNLIGRGTGSQFESFTMNYEFLLWKRGSIPSKKSAKTKIYVSETFRGILINKKYD